jgi:hypothetical protein
MKNITITPVLNGWRVLCGCQEVVFDDRTKLVKELDEYLRDPEAVEKRYLTTAVNRAYTNAVPRPPETCGQEAMPATRILGERPPMGTSEAQRDLARR